MLRARLDSVDLLGETCVPRVCCALARIKSRVLRAREGVMGGAWGTGVRHRAPSTEADELAQVIGWSKRLAGSVQAASPPHSSPTAGQSPTRRRGCLKVAFW